MKLWYLPVRPVVLPTLDDERSCPPTDDEDEELAVVVNKPVPRTFGTTMQGRSALNLGLESVHRITTYGSLRRTGRWLHERLRSCRCGLTETRAALFCC